MKWRRRLTVRQNSLVHIVQAKQPQLILTRCLAILSSPHFNSPGFVIIRCRWFMIFYSYEKAIGIVGFLYEWQDLLGFHGSNRTYWILVWVIGVIELLYE